MVSPAPCCYSQPCAMLLPCLPVWSHPDFVPEKSCAPGLTDSGSTYCTNTIEVHRILIQLSTNTALSFIFRVIAALVPSSPTSLLEMSLLTFHLCTRSGSIIQRPTNKPFNTHSYSVHEITFDISGIDPIPSLLWYDLVFQAGLSRARSIFWQR